MTVRITVNRICDRCYRPFDGIQLEQGDSIPEFDRTHYVMTSEHIDGSTGEVIEKTLIDYSDLCDPCEGVVEKAVAKLRMDKTSPTVSEPEPEQSSPKPVDKKPPSRKELAKAIARKTEKKLSETREEVEELSTPRGVEFGDPLPEGSDEPEPDMGGGRGSSPLSDPPIPLPNGQPGEAQPDEDLPF